MTRLDVDIGNTRTKWRFGNTRGVAPGAVPPTLADLPDRVCIACVAAERDEVGARFASAFGFQPEFAETTARLAGVTCGYESPGLLGVDRWLALVAAWNAARQPTVVADIGTAATLDFVLRDGRHVGGYIVPGLGTMVRTLARDTARVRLADERLGGERGSSRRETPRERTLEAEGAACGTLAPGLLPGRDTEQAVRRGTTAMLVAFVESSVARFSREVGEAPVLFLTGGDAEDLAVRLSLPVRVEPDLVLDGLALALP